MFPEHFLFDSNRTALAGELAEIIECYNITSPASERIGQDEVEAVYQTIAAGKNVQSPLRRLVGVVTAASINMNHVYAQDMLGLVRRAEIFLVATSFRERSLAKS